MCRVWKHCYRFVDSLDVIHGSGTEVYTTHRYIVGHFFIGVATLRNFIRRQVEQFLKILKITGKTFTKLAK